MFVQSVAGRDDESLGPSGRREADSSAMEFLRIDSEDRELIEAARDVLRRNYDPVKHTVGAAVRSGSGRIYTGINIKACAYRPCAEPIALGAAFSNGEKQIVTIVAVGKEGQAYPILPPCGNCRQLLIDYAPGAMVILNGEQQAVVKTSARNLLPGAYTSDFEDA